MPQAETPIERFSLAHRENASGRRDPAVRTRGAREDEMTTESDLVLLAQAGWDLRQLQVRAEPTPAEGALAAMITRVRQVLEIEFDRTEAVK